MTGSICAARPRSPYGALLNKRNRDFACIWWTITMQATETSRSSDMALSSIVPPDLSCLTCRLMDKWLLGADFLWRRLPLAAAV